MELMSGLTQSQTSVLVFIPSALVGYCPLHVIGGKSGSWFTSGILSLDELRTENFPVWIFGDFFDLDTLLIVTDLVDNELDRATT